MHPLRLFLLLCLLFLSGCQRKSAVPNGSKKPSAETISESPVREESAGTRQVSVPHLSDSIVNPIQRQTKGTAGSLPPTASEEPLEKTSEAPAEKLTRKYPPHGSAIRAVDAHELLSGSVEFLPQPIPSSGTPINPETPLDVGQNLQIKWGDQWWAGTVLGMEKDGKVRVHYFGWQNSWDESKPRHELQLDPDARIHAIDSTYQRNDW